MSVASLLIVAAAAPPSVPSLRAAPPALGVRRDFAAGLAEAVHIDPTARAASTRRLAKGGGSSSLAECVDHVLKSAGAPRDIAEGFVLPRRKPRDTGHHEIKHVWRPTSVSTLRQGDAPTPDFLLDLVCRCAFRFVDAERRGDLRADEIEACLAVLGVEVPAAFAGVESAPKRNTKKHLLTPLFTEKSVLPAKGYEAIKNVRAA